MTEVTIAFDRVDAIISPHSPEINVALGKPADVAVEINGSSVDVAIPRTDLQMTVSPVSVELLFQNEAQFEVVAAIGSGTAAVDSAYRGWARYQDAVYTQAAPALVRTHLAFNLSRTSHNLDAQVVGHAFFVGDQFFPFGTGYGKYRIVLEIDVVPTIANTDLTWEVEVSGSVIIRKKELLLDAGSTHPTSVTFDFEVTNAMIASGLTFNVVPSSDVTLSNARALLTVEAVQ